MTKLLQGIISSLCLFTVLVGSAYFFVHSRQVNASGTPQLYTSNPYDNPSYDHRAVYIGIHFSASSTVTLTWNYSPVGTVSAGTVQTNTYGKFWFVIQHMPSIPYKTVATLYATDTNGLKASTHVIENPFIIAKPNNGSIGSTVNVDGGGYGSSETVNVYFNQAQSIVVATTTSTSIGEFNATFKVPAGSELGGSNLTIEARGASGADVYTTFVVIPHIHISPYQGPSGTTITVNGSYFTPNSQASIYWYDPVSHSTSYLTGSSVSNTGTFQIVITAPAGLTAGVHYRVLANDISGQGCLAYFTAQA